MIKISKIIGFNNYEIICEFNDKSIKSLDLRKIIDNHKHLNGIKNLENKEILNSAKVGIFGEIYWEDIIQTTKNGQKFIWNYDISPEFFYQNGVNL
ncbi:MAG: hypothetical protein H6604_03770 [Flavobacteriales bacterium]|nr:hypothetical protein [Flavobacteriales bacterium]